MASKMAEADKGTLMSEIPPLFTRFSRFQSLLEKISKAEFKITKQ